MPDELDPPSASQSVNPPTPPPAPSQEPLGVTFGKPLGKVPDNFLGAGIVGEGWTVIGEHVMNGQRVVQLGRRVSQTGAIEQHEIDADTFARTKKYKEEQGGMSKNKKAPILGEADLGRALDPQGNIRPDFFDSASGMWHIQPNPGSSQPVWIADSLIRDFKAGKPGALEKLRDAAGTNKQEEASVGAQLAAGVATAVLGKSFTKAVGLPGAKTSPTTPAASEPSPNDPTKKKPSGADISPADRAKEEQDERDKHLKGEDDEDESEEESEAPGFAHRTTTFTATNKPGESAQVRAENPEVSPSVRIPTNTQTRTRSVQNTGTSLSVTPAPEQVSPQPSPAPRTTPPTEDQARQTYEQRFRTLSSNPAFKELIFTDIDRMPEGSARTELMQKTLHEWDDKQHSERVQKIEKQYAELEKNPAFKKAAYEEGLRRLQNDPDNVGLDSSSGLRTDAQIKEKAVAAWLAAHPEDATGDLNVEVDPVKATLARAEERKEKRKKAEVAAVALTSAAAAAATAASAAPLATVASSATAITPTGSAGRTPLRAPRAPRSSVSRTTSSASSSPSLPQPGPSSVVQSPSASVSAPQQPDSRGWRDQLRSERSSNRPRSSGKGPSSGATPSSPRPSSGGATASTAGIAASTAAIGAGISEVLASFATAAANTARAVQGLSREQALSHVRRLLSQGEAHAKYAATRAKELADKNPASAIAQPTGTSPLAEEELLSSQESNQEQVPPGMEAGVAPQTSPSPGTATSTTIPSNDLAAAQVMAELLAMDQSLASLRSLEGAILALPADGTVPSDVGATLPTPPTVGTPLGASAVGAPLGTTPTEPGGVQETAPSALALPEEQPLPATNNTPSRPVASPVIQSAPISEEPVQPLPTQSPASAPPQVPPGSHRVGPAPLSRRAPARPTSGVFGGLKSQVLGGAFAAMTSLNAAQASDRGGSLQQNDAREMTLGSDTSSSGDSSVSSRFSPLALGGHHRAPSVSAEDAPDVLTSPNEEASEMRAEAERGNATRQQFSGGGDEPAAPSEEQTPSQEESSQETGANQGNDPAATDAVKAVRMQAAQQSDKRKEEEKEKADPKTTATTETTRKPATGSEFVGRFTKGKLVFDIIEGCLDGSFGFLQFLFESDLALINDKYLHFKAIPYSLKTPGESERSERYTQYAVILLNVLIASVVFLNIAALVIVIYIIVDIVT